MRKDAPLRGAESTALDERDLPDCLATVTMEAGSPCDRAPKSPYAASYPELTTVLRLHPFTGIWAQASLPPPAISPRLGETYADKAAEAAGVKTFINLAGYVTEARATQADDSYYSKQNVVFLNTRCASRLTSFKEQSGRGLPLHHQERRIWCTAPRAGTAA